MSIFNYLQKQFRKLSILTHFNSNLQLYADLDVSKVYDFDAIVYHIIIEKIHSILFLNKELKVVEKNYWSTELKVTDLVWVVWQVRHMIESIKFFIIVYTDHFATVSIARQISLMFINVNKLNLRLIRVSQYLSMFELNIRYKSDIRNIVLDILSRLLKRRVDSDLLVKDKEDILNTLHVCVWFVTLIEMWNEFCRRLVAAIAFDEIWKEIIKSLKDDTDSSSTKESYFEFIDNLLYHVIKDKKRLVISRIMKKKFFKMTHRSHHAEFHRFYHSIAKSLYVRNLFTRFRKFLKNCSQCSLYQTKRHLFYEKMQLIRTINILFHTITMNFVLALLLSENDMNCMLTITNEFFKRVISISDKITHDAQQWAYLVLNRL